MPGWAASIAAGYGLVPALAEVDQRDAARDEEPGDQTAAAEVLVEQHGADDHPDDHTGFAQGRDSCERPTRLGPQHDEVRGEGERTAEAAQSPVRGRRLTHPGALRDERVQGEG